MNSQVKSHTSEWVGFIKKKTNEWVGYTYQTYLSKKKYTYQTNIYIFKGVLKRKKKKMFQRSFFIFMCRCFLLQSHVAIHLF